MVDCKVETGMASIWLIDEIPILPQAVLSGAKTVIFGLVSADVRLALFTAALKRENCELEEIKVSMLGLGAGFVPLLSSVVHALNTNTMAVRRTKDKLLV
jgi:xanthine/uracil permease